MDLVLFVMLKNKLMKKDTYIVPYQAPLIILYIKSAVCMANNGKENKHTRHITRRIYFVRNFEERNLHKTVWCEGGLKLSEIGTKNFR